ncbi:MAG: DUF3769 domain-containing protein [Leptolyngbyaceae cyanobacterium T60_A2020_046]|nr:DUF3769 domain-containing protein [Leptolyngbyaceae cyanobacterium T60_A2020_046]
MKPAGRALFLNLRRLSMPYPLIPPDLPPVVEVATVIDETPVAEPEEPSGASSEPTRAQARQRRRELRVEESATPQFSDPAIATVPSPRAAIAEGALNPSATPQPDLLSGRVSLAWSPTAQFSPPTPTAGQGTTEDIARSPQRAEPAPPEPSSVSQTQRDRRRIGDQSRPDSRWRDGAVTRDGELLTPSAPSGQSDVLLDLSADSQEFDPDRQVVIAEGNALLRIANGILSADRLWINLFNRYVLAEGNVVLSRGDQIIRAGRAEYNLLQGAGTLYEARGDVDIATLDQDFAELLTDNPRAETDPLSDRLNREGPLEEIQAGRSLTLRTGRGNIPGARGRGSANRIRFEAAQIDFDAEGWVAQDIRLTNDPFSPPELELRGETARLVRISEEEDRLEIERGRFVFDQSFSLPLFPSSVIFRRGEVDDLNPLPTGIGIDGRDRGGLFVERRFEVATADPWRLRVTPQFFIERFISTGDLGDLANYGTIFDLTGRIGRVTTVNATADFSGLDLANVGERLRASVRVQRPLGRHRLALEYSYRDRLFNGSLGFQDVQNSLGAIITSPNYNLGNTGTLLSYQVGAQYVTAETDRQELLGPAPLDDLVSLGRFQGSVFVRRPIRLWEGTPLPPTRDEGLRFTPRPVVPYVDLFLGSRSTYAYYTSEDNQFSVDGRVGLDMQFGHFSRNFFDYTAINVTYRRPFVTEGRSPFRFDREVDRERINFGVIQQIYGPIRAGFQTSINLRSGNTINTDYIMEYSRRTYGIVFRINPVQSSGFIGFRLSGFDWSGRAASFGGADIRQVKDGLVF